MLKFLQSTGWVAVLAVAAIFATTAPSTSAAERTEKNTIMTVGEMCGGCVKKITKRFDGLKGIAEVRCSIKENRVTVVPEKDVRLSPRGVWEAMEQIGKTPKKMVCPFGTFTKKPPK